MTLSVSEEYEIHIISNGVSKDESEINKYIRLAHEESVDMHFDLFIKLFNKLGYRNVTLHRVMCENFMEVVGELQSRRDAGHRIMVIQLCDGIGDGEDGDGYPGVEVVDALEAIKIPYSGANPSFYRNSCSKTLMKNAMIREGVSTSPFIQIRGTDDETLMEDLANAESLIGYPMFVKPETLYDAIGIDDHSVVHNCEEAAAQIRRVWSKCFGRVFVERYLPGREFTVLLFDLPMNAPSQFPSKLLSEREFPPTNYTSSIVKDSLDYSCNMPLDSKPEGESIVNPSNGTDTGTESNSETSPSYQVHDYVVASSGPGNYSKPEYLIRVYPPGERFLKEGYNYMAFEDFVYPGENVLTHKPTPAEFRDRVMRLAFDAYRAVGGTGYGRVDIRTDSKDLSVATPYVLEVNAMPGVYYSDSSNCEIITTHGGSHDELVRALVHNALLRE